MEKHVIKLLNQLNNETKEHSIRVAELFKNISKDAGLETRLSWEIGILHDIGKMFIPSRILRKSSRLTGFEREIIDAHSYYGYRYLSEEGYSDDICIPVLYHHGFDKYPNLEIEITDEQIKYIKALHTIDVYDAITNNRCYRKKMSKSEAYDIMTDDEMIEEKIKELLFKNSI